MFGTQCKILAGSKAAEFTKFVDEMGLIGIAKRKRKIDPIDGYGIVDSHDDVAKALNTAEQLRSHSDFVAEQIDKPSLTQVHFLCDAGARLQPRVFLENI